MPIQTPNIHYESIYANSQGNDNAFVVNTIGGYQGVAKSSSFETSGNSTGVPNSANTTVRIVNQYYALSNPA